MTESIGDSDGARLWPEREFNDIPSLNDWNAYLRTEKESDY